MRHFDEKELSNLKFAAIAVCKDPDKLFSSSLISWNPYANDWDAFAIVTELGMNIYASGSKMTAELPSDSDFPPILHSVAVTTTKAKAMREAIVLVAAEYGRCL